MEVILDASQSRQNSEGKSPAVLLDIATHERLIEAEEDLGDIRSYDEIKAKVNTELQACESVTLESYKTKNSFK